MKYKDSLNKIKNQPLQVDKDGNYYSTMRMKKMAYLFFAFAFIVIGVLVYSLTNRKIEANEIVDTCCLWGVLCGLFVVFGIFILRKRFILTNNELVMVGVITKRISYSELIEVAKENPPYRVNSIYFIRTKTRFIRLDFGMFTSGVLFSKELAKKMELSEENMIFDEDQIAASSYNLYIFYDLIIHIFTLIIAVCISFLSSMNIGEKIALWLYPKDKVGAISSYLYLGLWENIWKMIPIILAILFLFLVFLLGSGRRKKIRRSMINSGESSYVINNTTANVGAILFIGIFFIGLIGFTYLKDESVLINIIDYQGDIEAYNNQQYKITKGQLSFDKNKMDSSKVTLAYSFNVELESHSTVTLYCPIEFMDNLVEGRNNYEITYLPGTGTVINFTYIEEPFNNIVMKSTKEQSDKIESIFVFKEDRTFYNIMVLRDGRERLLERRGTWEYDEVAKIMTINTQTSHQTYDLKNWETLEDKKETLDVTYNQKVDDKTSVTMDEVIYIFVNEKGTAQQSDLERYVEDIRSEMGIQGPIADEKSKGV